MYISISDEVQFGFIPFEAAVAALEHGLWIELTKGKGNMVKVEALYPKKTGYRGEWIYRFIAGNGEGSRVTIEVMFRPEGFLRGIKGSRIVPEHELEAAS